ncbi:MAG: ATP-dependent helicase, partial [Vampirovibrionales bacterium]
MSTPVLSSAPSFGVSPVAGQLTQYLQQHIQLNPQQHEACYTPATQGLQVLAGAGTGKTMLITARTLYLMDTLLAEGIADPESRLLVLTFTKDAAREMKERIHHHLQKAGWQGALPQENVSNFHSFCMGFLKRHLLELGLPTGFSLLDEAEQAKVRAKLQRLLEANQLNNIHSTLQQVGLAEGVPKACLSIDSLKQQPFESVDALVQAWLGVIQRAKALGWSPREFWVHTRQQTLALAEMFKTLPPTASDTVELMHAWRSKVGAWASPEWVYSFEEAQCVDEKSLYKQLRDAHFGHLWKTKFCLEEGGRGNKLPAPKLPDWQAFDVQVQAELRLIDQVAAFYALYQQELRLQGALDFDDLINETVRILSTHSEIRYRYQQQFKAVLVDEFQDTNGSQLALLRLLSTLPSTAKDPCNITVVGDAKQSIYGFRFAQKENLSLIFDALPPETFRCVTLTQNYRSLPPVVAAANTVAHHVTLGDASAVYEKPLQAFQSLPSHDASSSSPPPEWVQWWQFVTPKKDDPELYSPLSRTERGIQALMGDLEQHQRHTPNFHYGQVCMLVQTHSEAARIAEALEERHIPYLLSQDASFFQAPAVKNLLALLRLLAEPNHQASWARLLQWQLPKTTLLCLWHTVQRFLHQPEAFLTIEQTQTVLNQPLNQRWLWVWQALLNGEVTLTPVQLAQLPQGLDTLLTALAPQENMPRLPVATWMNDLAHWFQRFQTEPTLPTLQALLTYWDTSLPTASAFQREQNKLLMQQVWLLVHQHSSLAQRKRKLRLSDICTELERLAKDERVQLPSVVKAARHQGQATPAVQLMTVHASKGLEFPHVYVWWLGKGNNRSDALLFEPQYEGKAGFGLILKQNQSPNRAFPLVKPALWHDVWEAPRREREKERLFYVALTRAKQTLRVLVPASTVGDE